MLEKIDRFAGGYYCDPYEPPGESEGCGSSGQIDNAIASSEYSSHQTRRCIGLNLDKGHTFGVTSAFPAKHKSSIISSGPGKKNNPSSVKVHKFSRDVSGRFESAKRASAVNTARIILMKQCEGLLKRLMSHQYGWVFNKPVDIVKLNIPDYVNVIKHPMDLGTVKKKIASVRWKNIEKKLPVTGAQLVQSKAAAEDIKTSKTMPPAKKRKMTSVTQEVIPGPVKRITDEEKHNLGRELESLFAEMPIHIIDFLKEHCSNGTESGEEIEIDIDILSDDILLTLRKLLDDYLKEKQKNQSRAEPCEIELQNESGLSNSSLQQGKGNDQDDEPPVSSYPPVEIEKDTGHRNSKSVSPGSTRSSDIGSSSDGEHDGVKIANPVEVTMVLEAAHSGAQLDEKTCVENHLDSTVAECVSVLDQPEHTYQPKLSSVELDGCQDDTILKEREKTLTQGEKGDPEQLRREREELEQQRKKEKARLQAEAKAAEDAQRRAVAEAAAEARRKREAARQALLKVEECIYLQFRNSVLNIHIMNAKGWTSRTRIPRETDNPTDILIHTEEGNGQTIQKF
ncbi:hypothetical protein V6N13_003359 [Hibiscus sabdariffa]